jgi:hypothetical protein
MGPIKKSATIKRRSCMKRIKQLSFFSCLITLFLLSSCATTVTTNVWRDQSYGGAVKKVLVMGISQKQGIQRFFEDEFVRQLREKGTDGIAGYTVLPYDEKMTKDFIAARARESGADAVLVARPLSREVQRTYVPGQVYAVPGSYSRWGSYYGHAYSPGYVVEDEYVYIETNLYDVATEKLIWSTQSETVILASDQELIKSFISTMVAQLSSDKLIK